MRKSLCHHVKIWPRLYSLWFCNLQIKTSKYVQKVLTITLTSISSSRMSSLNITYIILCRLCVPSINHQGMSNIRKLFLWFYNQNFWYRKWGICIKMYISRKNRLVKKVPRIGIYRILISSTIIIFEIVKKFSALHFLFQNKCKTPHLVYGCFYRCNLKLFYSQTWKLNECSILKKSLQIACHIFHCLIAIKYARN